MWNGDRLYTDKHQHIMKCWKVGDEMAEDRWHPCCQFGVDKAYARHTGDLKTWTKAEYPFQRDFVVEIITVLLAGPIMPNVHDDHEDAREDDG